MVGEEDGDGLPFGHLCGPFDGLEIGLSVVTLFGGLDG
jgi:hypothetical protein